MKSTSILPNSIVLMAIIALCPQAILADEFRARIVKVQGNVYIVNSGGEQRKPEKTQFLVNKMDTVITGERSKAVVQFDDGVLSVIDEKSSLRVEESGWLSQLGGKIYYVFRKVFKKEEQKKVKTSFATIGIRGTTFIVYENGDTQGVALEQGKLNIESPAEAYEIHKKKQADDFEAFKQQAAQQTKELNDEFKDYKDQLSKDFIEYKKDFDLEENRVVSFTGNRVDEKPLSDDIVSEFESFGRYAEDYIDAYKELDDMSMSDF